LQRFATPRASTLHSSALLSLLRLDAALLLALQRSAARLTSTHRLSLIHYFQRRRFAPPRSASPRAPSQLSSPHRRTTRCNTARLNARFVLIHCSFGFIAPYLSALQHPAPLRSAPHRNTALRASARLSASRLAAAQGSSAQRNVCPYSFLPSLRRSAPLLSARPRYMPQRTSTPRNAPRRYAPRLCAALCYAPWFIAARLGSLQRNDCPHSLLLWVPRTAPPPFAATQRPSIPPGSAPRASSQHSTALHNATFFRLEMLS
jgi:hypothetical protein